MTVLQGASQQLRDLEGRLAASNPQLYRHIALYLQVLRDGLLNTVQQASFTLVTQVHPERYRALPALRRRTLHRRMASLVQRACSLLTVEQVVHLAAQMAEEQQRQRRRQRQRLLEALDASGDQPSTPEPEEPGVSAAQAWPEGSVRLGLALPIGPERFQLPRLEPFDTDASHPASADDSGPGGPFQGDPFQGDPSPAGPSRGEPSQGESSPGPPAHGEPVRAADELPDAVMAAALEAWMEQQEGGAPRTPWAGGQLPTDPLLLLAWLQGVDAAIGRRLRNLSHALNVELLRLGVSRTLLPVGLLEAALSGQLETLAAPANLLRLPLPFGPEPGAERLEALVVLLRAADLELEQPKLRTCRSRIQQHRQEVRRMAQHYRRIQRRVQALEAEQLWLQDINSARPPQNPPA